MREFRKKKVKKLSILQKFMEAFFSNTRGVREGNSMEAHENRMKARRRKTKFHK